MQKIFVIGHVGNDPKVKVFENGGKAANFSVAETEREKKLKDGRTIPARTTWFDCVAKGVTADFVEKYIKKGDKITVLGSLSYREYEKKEGGKGYVTDIIGYDVILPKQESNRPPQVGEADIPAPTEIPPMPPSDGLPW